MTNEIIILTHRLELMEQGLISSTGRTFQYKDADGNTKELAEPEMIHTYAGWQEIGYQVRKGEKSKIQFSIWKYCPKHINKKGAEVKEKMIMKNSYFFTAAQVDKI